jgi:predicted NBD/HSP70 family sugar kinase
MIMVFDIGATHTRLAFAENGQVRDVRHLETDHSAAGLARLLGAMAAFSAGRKLRAVVGGMPGELEGPVGKLVLSPNLPNWVGLPVRLRMQAMFDCPLFIHNDLVMCGLGEAHAGAGVNQGVMVYYTVSTGVNAVRLVDGQLDTSIKRFEIGFQLAGQEDGKIQSLESLIGGGAMEQRFGRAPEDVHAQKTWRLAERNLAHGLYNTLLHWTPDVVVFGGSMMRDIQIQGVNRELSKLPQVLTRLPELKEAKLGDLAGIYGAIQWWESHGREREAKQPA